MYNFETKFNNWLDKMNKKSDKERHNFAITVSLFLTAIVSFFIISSWYYQISGNNITGSFFVDIEQTYYQQKELFLKARASFSEQTSQFLEILNQNSTPATIENIEEIPNQNPEIIQQI